MLNELFATTCKKKTCFNCGRDFIDIIVNCEVDMRHNVHGTLLHKTNLYIKYCTKVICDT